MKYQWKSIGIPVEILIEISMKYQLWKSFGNPVIISMKYQWKSIEIQLEFNRITIKYQWKSNGNPVEIQ